MSGKPSIIPNLTLITAFPSLGYINKFFCRKGMEAESKSLGL
jgi:hypothetical protein